MSLCWILISFASFVSFGLAIAKFYQLCIICKLLCGLVVNFWIILCDSWILSCDYASQFEAKALTWRWISTTAQESKHQLRAALLCSIDQSPIRAWHRCQDYIPATAPQCPWPVDKSANKKRRIWNLFHSGQVHIGGHFSSIKVFREHLIHSTRAEYLKWENQSDKNSELEKRKILLTRFAGVKNRSL